MQTIDELRAAYDQARAEYFAASARATDAALAHALSRPHSPERRAARAAGRQARAEADAAYARSRELELAVRAAETGAAR